MRPIYNLDKIKFATDPGTFERAVDIYESGGVQNFQDTGFGFVANARGRKHQGSEALFPKIPKIANRDRASVNYLI